MICFDRSSLNFPEEPDIPEEIRAAVRASLVQWLKMRLEEFGDECLICDSDPDSGTLDVIFPALPAAQLVEELKQKEIECTTTGKRRVRFCLSAGQQFEPLDKVQAVLMEILHIY